MPYYHVKSYLSSVANTVYLDGSYFDGNANQPAVTQDAWTMYAAGPQGFFMWQGYGAPWTMWSRMGIANSSASAQTVNVKIRGADDGIQVYLGQAANSAGTIALTNGSSAATGTGTSFLTQLAVGDLIRGAGGVYSRVSAVVSDTSATLQELYVGTSASSVSYKIVSQICAVVHGSGFSTANGSGAVAASSTATLHVFAHNTASEMTPGALLDAFDNSSLTFVDAGP